MRRRRTDNRGRTQTGHYSSVRDGRMPPMDFGIVDSMRKITMLHLEHRFTHFSFKWKSCALEFLCQNFRLCAGMQLEGESNATISLSLLALQKRPVDCVMSNGTVLDPMLCNERDKPTQKKECYNENCVGQWKVSEWSHVSRLPFVPISPLKYLTKP